MCSKGALDLLGGYGSDTSDDEVPGFRVSTKRTHKESADDEDADTKRLARLPLPSMFTKTVNEVPFDDCSLYDGRKRSFAHEQGNWASYLYLPIEVDIGIRNLLEELLKIPNLDLKPISHFHISITKTVILRHHWINAFIATVNQKLCCIPKFVIVFDSLKVYCNEEKTRTFVALHTGNADQMLRKIVKKLDQCLTEFQLPLFYEEPSFHMSIAWCLGDHQQDIEKLLKDNNIYFKKYLTNYIANNWCFQIDNVQCNIGNKSFKFRLQ